MKLHFIHSLATGAVALALIAPIAISTSLHADNEQPNANAQFFNSSRKNGEKADEAIEKAKKRALRKKEEDAKNDAAIRAAAKRIRLEEEKRAKAERKRQAEIERRRIREARRQAQLEAKRQKLARQKAERLERQRLQRIRLEALREAELAEKRAQEVRRLAAIEAERQEQAERQERARRNADKHRAAEIKTTSIHTKSSPPQLSNITAPSLNDHTALHKHYANWISYYAGGSVSRTSIDEDSAASLGAFAGKNWQKGKYVYGIEGEVSLLNGEKTNSDGLHFDANWMLSAKGRAGYLVRPDTLLYATGGVAFANFDISLDSKDYSDTLVGFIIGAGVEHQLDEDWSVRAEYAYTNFGTEKVKNSSFDPDIHAIKVSFSYNF